MAGVDYANLAGEILTKVGGEDNVKLVSHCATRLRFVLKDSSKADKAAVSTLPGVITAVENGGQFQVVIGNNVPLVYAELGKTSSVISDDRKADEGDAGVKKGNIFGRGVSAAIDVVSAIFAPVIGTLCGVGILKGLLQIAVTAGWLSNTSSTYQVLWAAADAFFFFLPIILAVPAARKFGANVYTSMGLAGALIYTQVASVNLVLDGKAVSQPLRAFQTAGGSVDFFGIPVVLQGYTATVVPVILAVLLQSRIEKLISKYLHDSIRNFVVPLVALVICVPATLIVLGPLGNWLGRAIADAFLAAQGFSPILTGIVFAALWQVLVVFGVHWALVPIFINNIATIGYDSFKPLVWPAVFGQAGAAFGVFLRLREARQRGIAGSAVIAGLFGITEPAIYGVNLPRKRVFAIGLISAAVGGAIVGGGGAKVYGYGLSGILTLPLGYGDPKGLGDTFLALLLGTIVSFVLAAALTYFFGMNKEELKKDREAAAALHTAHDTHTGHGANAATAAPATSSAGNVATLSKTDLIEVHSPMVGTAVALNEVPDAVFSSGAMGAGFAVVPTSGRVLAPMDGTIVAAMPHAIGMKSDSGAELLIHVGIDTVQLNGRHFQGYVTKGQRVSRGDVLIDADLDAIAADGYDLTTMIIVTNTSKFGSVIPEVEGPVDTVTPALIIRPKE